MLIDDYSLEFTRSKCNPHTQGIHCIAHFNRDISEVIPYLNAELGGDACSDNPPFVTFKVHGKLITVHPDKIAINALKDQDEAKKVMKWMVREINRVWDERDNITPTYEVLPKPQPIEILKFLPKTNCKKCGYPTCLVFAVHVREGGVDIRQCPELNEEKLKEIEKYLSSFKRLSID